MKTEVTIVIEVHDEHADPDDATGLTEEAYDDLFEAGLPGDIIDVRRRA